jgi:ribosomal protein L11 methyltransferase
VRWAEIGVECPAAGEEPVAAAMMAVGCAGAAVASAQTEGAALGPGLLRITGYLPVDDRLEGRLVELRGKLRDLREWGLPLGEQPLTVRWAEDEDWAQAWKRFFRPFRVGRQFVICPTWEVWDASPGDRVLTIDPGMAFGTGTHPSTQLCLELMEGRIVPGAAVLDIGTGSGILAIAAAALGATPIVAVDLDPVAVAAARGNLLANGLARDIQLLVGTARAVGGRYDWVLANLIADVIREDAALLAGRLRAGGRLVASGIIGERGPEVAKALTGEGLQIEAEATREGWVAFIARARDRDDGRV